MTVDCHRQARYLSFEQQFGTLLMHEQLREDRYIYHAIEEACLQLLSMLEAPKPLSEYETVAGGTDGITSVLVREIRAERVLLQRCVHDFQQRQQELEPRPVPAVLAEPLARLRSQVAAEDGAGNDQLIEERAPLSSMQWSMAEGISGGYNAASATGMHRPQETGRARAGFRTREAPGGGGGAPGGAFATPVDRSRVDQLLQRLQMGASLA